SRRRCSLSAVTMYFGGDVCSRVDPSSTALGCTDGKVSVIGFDAAARALDTDAIDYAEHLLATWLVHDGRDRHGTAPRAAQLHVRGFTHAHAIGPAEAIAEFAAEAPTGLSVVDYPLLAAAGAEAGRSSASATAGTVSHRAAVDAADFLALEDL